MNKALPLLVPAVLLLAAGIVAGPVLVLPEGIWYQSHDGLRYPFLLYYFQKALDAGIWYPRWLPDLAGGYGYPTFVFYQPGYFYFSLPFSYALSLLAAVKASLFAMVLLGAAGAYRVARLTHPCGMSLICAVLFLFTPYTAMEIYIRGDLSELMAMELCPWSLYYALRFMQADARKQAMYAALGFVIATAAIIISHPFVAFFWLPFLVALGWSQPKESWPAGMLLVALAVVLTASYWLPLLQLKEMVRYGSAVSGGYDFRRYMQKLDEVLPFNPYSLIFWYRWGALIALALAWREGKLWRAIFIYYLAGLYLISVFSMPVWELLRPVLKFIQFPWRMNSVLATVQLLGWVYLGKIVQRFILRRGREGRAWVAAGAVGLLLLAGMPFRFLPTLEGALRPVVPEVITWDIFSATHPLRELPFADVIAKRERYEFLTLQSTGELDPKTSSTRGLLNRHAQTVPPAELRDGAGEVEALPDSVAEHMLLRVRLNAPDVLRVNQFYFPGWQVTVNGTPVSWEADAPAPSGFTAANGRIGVRFAEPGEYEIAAWYDGPPGWQARNALMVLTALIISWLFYKRLAREPRFATTPSA